MKDGGGSNSLAVSRPHHHDVVPSPLALERVAQSQLYLPRIAQSAPNGSVEIEEERTERWVPKVVPSEHVEHLENRFDILRAPYRYRARQAQVHVAYELSRRSVLRSRMVPFGQIRADPPPARRPVGWLATVPFVPSPHDSDTGCADV